MTFTLFPVVTAIILLLLKLIVWKEIPLVKQTSCYCVRNAEAQKLYGAICKLTGRKFYWLEPTHNDGHKFVSICAILLWNMRQIFFLRHYRIGMQTRQLLIKISGTCPIWFSRRNLNGDSSCFCVAGGEKWQIKKWLDNCRMLSATWQIRKREFLDCQRL